MVNYTEEPLELKLITNPFITITVKVFQPKRSGGYNMDQTTPAGHNGQVLEYLLT